MSEKARLANLSAVYGALYQVFGRAPPTVSNDGAVDRLYDVAVRSGKRCHELREGGVTIDRPLPVVVAGAEAATEESSGALALYFFSMVVAPRLLVSLRDARYAEPAEPWRAWLDGAANELVEMVNAVAESAKTMTAIDDEAFVARARDLRQLVDGAGFSESFGPFA